MTFDNYPAFRLAVLSLLDGDDISQSTFSLTTADLLIGLGEGRVYNGDPTAPALRASCMVAPFVHGADDLDGIEVASNAIDLPADLLELKEVWFSGQPPLELIPLNKLRTLEASGLSTGQSAYAAQDGDTLRFWPTATGTVLGRYWKRPAALKAIADDDWTAGTPEVARYPELFIYACLIESAPFLGFDERMPMWQEQYRLKAWGANQTEQMRALGGSPLRIRAR